MYLSNIPWLQVQLVPSVPVHLQFYEFVIANWLIMRGHAACMHAHGKACDILNAIAPLPMIPRCIFAKQVGVVVRISLAPIHEGHALPRVIRRYVRARERISHQMPPRLSRADGQSPAC